MKRSNRLVLLIGIFLAIVAFVLVVMTIGNPTRTPEAVTPTTTPVVIAAKDIPLGAREGPLRVTPETLRQQGLPAPR